MTDTTPEPTDEEAITAKIAETFHFTELESGLGYKCNICERRLMLFAWGGPINERMINHYNHTHYGGHNET